MTASGFKIVLILAGVAATPVALGTDQALAPEDAEVPARVESANLEWLMLAHREVYQRLTQAGADTPIACDEHPATAAADGEQPRP